MSQASLDLAKHLYETVLGRDPDTGDQANLTACLDAGGDGAALIAGSAEAAAQVDAAYQQTLGRIASGAEVTASERYLAGGGTLAGLRAAAAGSREGGEAINQAYFDGLGRNASSADLTASERYLVGGGKLAGLRAIIAGSGEATAVMNSLYQAVLGRGADTAGRLSAQAAIASGASLNQIVAGMATSAEEGARLSATYKAAGGQAPDAAGLATMEGLVTARTFAGLLATLYQDGPANPFPVPDDTDGSFFTLEPGVGLGPTVAITGVTLGTESGITLRTASSAPTISGDVSAGSFILVDPNGQPVSHGTGTVAITASLLGLDLPASTFDTATVDAAGNWAAAPSHSLPDATYILTPTLAYTDGTTSTGTSFTLDVVTGAAHASAADLFAASRSAASAMPLLHGGKADTFFAAAIRRSHATTANGTHAGMAARATTSATVPPANSATET